MRFSLSLFSRTVSRSRTVTSGAVCLLTVFLLSPAHAEPPADLDLSLPSPLPGLEGQPQPVYPNGPPETESAGEPKPESETESAAKVEGEPAATEEEDKTEAAAPPRPAIVASIDKGRQEMTVFVDGVETHTWPVSTGIAGYSTPSGSFTASSMNKIWYSRQWDNAPMPHSVFFTKRGHAIHGTNEVKKLGSPASKGCIRLAPKNAETFFNLVKRSGLENTEVVLTGVTPGGEYKITEPTQRVYPGTRGYYDSYGRYRRYGEARPRTERRRRMFQPYYDSPPREYQRPQRRRWFRKRGY